MVSHPLIRHIPCAFLSPGSMVAKPIVVLSISASLFAIIVSRKQLFQPLFSWMSSKSWNRADSCAKVAASLFLACEASINPLLRLTIHSAMREKGYSKEETVNLDHIIWQLCKIKILACEMMETVRINYPLRSS